MEIIENPLCAFDQVKLLVLAAWMLMVVLWKAHMQTSTPKQKILIFSQPTAQ